MFIYGTAFRAPNPSELYYNDGGLTTKANPGLEPETITTYQAAWRQLLPHDFHLTLSGFQYETKDLISYRTDPADGLLQFVNLDRVRAVGGEVELEKNWSSGIRFRSSYTYQDARDTRTDKWLTRSPHHLAKLNLAIPILAEKIFASAELQYFGELRTLNGRDAPGYWVANATLFSQRIVKGLEFSAGIYNLLDRHYAHPAGSEHLQNLIRQDGRTFRVKLTWRF
jgi:iron complex outermembrane receptor protein